MDCICDQWQSVNLVINWRIDSLNKNKNVQGFVDKEVSTAKKNRLKSFNRQFHSRKSQTTKTINKEGPESDNN